MPQPTVSKHLRVLREAGFVESTVDAQRRLYRLKPDHFGVDAYAHGRYMNATSTAWINQHQRKGRQREEDDRSRAVHTGSGQRARVRKDGSGPHSRQRTAHPPEKWEALTDPAHLRGWVRPMGAWVRLERVKLTTWERPRRTFPSNGDAATLPRRSSHN
jgi:DNA-binding transcriptional ArsR family regulator